MANNQKRSDTPVRSSDSLAERLFVAAWRPGGGYIASHVAAQCIEAAEEFTRVQNERSDLRIAEPA